MESTHVPAQLSNPAAHTQAPSTQPCPTPQTIPHSPQLDGSLAVTTHAPSQSVSPATHPSVPPSAPTPPVD